VAAKSFQHRGSSAGTREGSQVRDSGNSQRQSQPGSTSHMAGAGKAHSYQCIIIIHYIYNCLIDVMVSRVEKLSGTTKFDDECYNNICRHQ